MKTKKSSIQHKAQWVQWGAWLLLCLCLSHAQIVGSPSFDAVASVDSSQAQSDAASVQLIANYLAVTGGREAHLRLRNIVAEGTIKESTLKRKFRLVESIDGKRHLSFFWTHLGRKQRVVYVHDGLQTWMQVMEPQKEEAKLYGGPKGTHFANQRWLLHPFTLPMLANYDFHYQGTANVSGRSAYLVKGDSKNGIHSWFYFDKETSLLTRWGGKGQIASSTEDMDYRAIAFKAFGGVLMPTRIDLLAENATFGYVTFEQIQINQNLDEVSFLMPRSMTPTLRQRPLREINAD